MKNKLLEEFKTIESDFFEIDEENKLARVALRFHTPCDIFDVNCLSKTPVFNDDFSEWLLYAFDVIPKKYKLDAVISFDDWAGYDEEDLTAAFKKNLLLSAKSSAGKVQRKNRIAYGLVGAGLLSFLTMMLISYLWHTDNFLHQIFFYIFDIATTVLFWEAAGILLVENREHAKMAADYTRRFHGIAFVKAENSEK